MYCDLGDLITNNFSMFIDIFKSDLKELGVESIYTKCLYTAVTVLYLICGHSAISSSLQCYVDNVKTRMAKKNLKEKEVFIRNSVKEGISSVLKVEKSRKVYFFMITNSELPHPQDPNKYEFFPGHVFVVDKQMKKGSDKPVYRIYQSYINKYTLQDYSRQINNNTGDLYNVYTYERMVEFTNNLSYFMNSKIWDARNVAFWRDFTLVDASNFKGYPIQPYIHFCYNVLPAIRCRQGLYDLLQEKKEKNQIPFKYSERVDALLKNRANNANP